VTENSGAKVAQICRCWLRAGGRILTKNSIRSVRRTNHRDPERQAGRFTVVDFAKYRLCHGTQTLTCQKREWSVVNR
jgi:hypothetical protein